MTPREHFAAVIAGRLYPTYREAWFDFENWERCRNFYDDPDFESKLAADWVRDLYELAVTLQEFPPSPAREACSQALEAACEAFAQVEHSEKLCTAVQQWKEMRMDEACAEDQAQ